MKKFIAIATILTASVFASSAANADYIIYPGYVAPVVVAPATVQVQVVKPVVEVQTVQVTTQVVTPVVTQVIAPVFPCGGWWY